MSNTAVVAFAGIVSWPAVPPTADLPATQYSAEVVRTLFVYPGAAATSLLPAVPPPGAALAGWGRKPPDEGALHSVTPGARGVVSWVVARGSAFDPDHGGIR
ncbi:MAG: hypothetical protein OXT72_05300 [Gammaproteobacteria bacterium]|nr:hypothetical protein [Gammaproteobacteria bacterium]MDE0248281.1 hypothetical protein [Gammaproteobacteria bacterium]